MKIEDTEIAGVHLITPTTFRDHRGYFYESHRTADIADRLGYAIQFVQGNVSSSAPFVLRGLHYQINQPQGKLVRALRGSIYDVAVDIRAGSPTFGKHVGRWLTAEGAQALYIPPGFAHGFVTAGEGALVHYECTSLYVEAWSREINYADPELAISWPAKADPLGPTIEFDMSNKDRGAPMLSQAEVFQYMPSPDTVIAAE